MVRTIIHTHVGLEYVKRACALYHPKVPLGTKEGAFYIVLNTLGNRAYPRLTTFARLSEAKPMHIPD